jgi:hypothetical protein
MVAFTDVSPELFRIFSNIEEHPDISLGHPNGQVVLFFISFPTTPISSQSNTRVESFDKNTKTCVESSWKPEIAFLMFVTLILVILRPFPYWTNNL